jgi:hypothetical protein
MKGGYYQIIIEDQFNIHSGLVSINKGGYKCEKSFKIIHWYVDYGGDIQFSSGIGSR